MPATAPADATAAPPTCRPAATSRRCRTTTRTQAERDYDALYGAQYDPVADPTLPTPA